MKKLLIATVAATVVAIVGMPQAAAATPLVYNADSEVLARDPGGTGRIVQVVGDLNTAERIVILVPGADTTAADFENGHGDVKRRAPLWQARQLYKAVMAENADAPVAVVAWLGYEPPPGMGVAVARSEVAEQGASELVRFTHWLGSQRQNATIMAIGHSYGTVVLGQAAPYLPESVTDLVAIGSPGMDVDDVQELNTTATVWAAAAQGDWITRIPDGRAFGFGHGADPTSKEFGAETFSVAGINGHDHYFTPKSESLRSLARISLRHSQAPMPEIQQRT